MAYVNVAEWSADQIVDWLKGLDGVLLQYIPLFLSSEVKGQQLLNLRSDDLENIGVLSIGHQELILEAVGQLRNFHYELDRENLQHLALKLSCVATSLYNELKHHQDISKVETQTLSDVTNVIAMVKPLACWLDRSPFSGQPNYTEKKSKLLRLSIEMATSGQRDRFAESPLLAIRESCNQLSSLANYIIQEISDPMLLQPATLDLATLKKREQELGFDILPSSNGIHQVIDIKFGSPAHSSGKIEDGDEIVQVNYQTVVGWQPKEVLLLCQESPADVLLTLKKRPRHTHTYGQIYMKPYRLPSRKRSTPYNRWGSLPSPRPELLAIRDFEMPLPRPSPVPIPPPQLHLEVSSSSDESEISHPGSPTSEHMSSQHRIYLPKPRSVVQRRNTTSGSSPISKRPNVSIEQFWRELRNHKSLQHTGSAQMPSSNDSDEISDNLYRRDKSVSCSTGLELSPRPKTCLGVGLNHSKVIRLEEKLNKVTDERTASKSVKFHDELVTGGKMHHIEETHVKEIKERGRLDKSHSTPAYDFGETDESEFPLMKEIIPESPTSSIDSPSIVVHSPEKVDQILGFKKYSNQIGGAMSHHKDRQKTSSGGALDCTDSDQLFGDKSTNRTCNKDNVVQILETINIALLEHRKKEDITFKKSTCNGQNIFQTEFGEPNAKKMYDSGMNEQIQTIQNELLEAINEQRKLSVEKSLEFNTHSKPDVPPEPPPRPPSTQKPGYIPPKPFKHIQKEDIQVILNKTHTSPIIPLRNDIPLPVGGVIPPSIGSGSLSSDVKHSSNNVSSIELVMPRTPLMPARSVQMLESDCKGLLGSKLDTSVTCLKTNDNSKLSVSPANSMVRGLLAAGKSKSLKKKNSILAKRRKISVKDLGWCDMEGYLYQRCRTKNNSNVNWQLRWFILLGNTFYGFKHKDSSKADCLIFLSGFTVTVAQEVKSKQCAFKIYHTGTVFYFASDTAESMAAWVECITRATLTNNDSWERASKKDKKTEESKHFSETDYSDDDLAQSHSAPNYKNKSDKQEKSEKSHKFGSLKKFTNRMHKSDSQENVDHSSTSLDRKYFNRFFSSKTSKSKEEKSKFKSNDVPVPTDRYRSYRKIPLSAPSVTDIPQASAKQASSAHTISQVPQEDSNDKISENIAKIKKIESIDNDKNIPEDDNLPDLTQKHQKKANPMNIIHASSPNFLDFEQSDFIAKPKCNTPFLKNIVQRQDNLIGFVTLQQFMLNKQEEERRQVYSNRVLMGVERDSRADEKNLHRKQERTLRDNNNLQKQLDKIVPDVIYGEIPTFLEKNISPSKMEQIQNRSLPKTPVVSISKLSKHSADTISSQNISSFKPLVEQKIDKTRTEHNNLLKSGAKKKKNDGYETIKYDETDDANPLYEMKYDKSIVGNPPPVPRKLSFQTIKDGYEKIVYDSDSITNKETADETKQSDYKSFAKAKDLGYEFIYGDDQPSLSNTELVKLQTKTDLGYKTLYSDNCLDVNNDSSVSDLKTMPRKLPIDLRKPVPPPKIMNKTRQPVSRQGSVTSVGDRKSSGIDTKPVFKQGDCPEKFWLDSLRRNDKVYTAKHNEHSNPSVKVDKFYTKHSEPSTYMKSSEATIVKSDKLQNKALPSSESTRSITSVAHKPLKSATQYTPMSLPLVSPNKSLKTSPQFELSLDIRETPTTPSGISRLRQMFQHGSAGTRKGVSSASASNVSPVKEKTLLGSPRLHRAVFRRCPPTPADEWTQDFVYSKGVPSTSYTDVSGSDSYLFSMPPSASTLTVPSCEGSSNASTPDYPHLEYPPVFEPETYTLADPGPSILRKMNHDSDKK